MRGVWVWRLSGGVEMSLKNENFEYFTKFGLLEFSTEELLTLTKVERQFLLAASLITNDIRFYWSLMSRSKSDSENDDVRTMQLVREFWTLRKLSAVIYEAQLALNGFVGQIDQLKSSIESGTPIISKSKNGKKYLELANTLRNKSAYHYGVGDLVKNIHDFAPDAKHRYYAHKQQGNSISSLCEQIVTLPVIRGAFEGANENDFHDWCKTASNSILNFCNSAIAQLVLNRFPTKKLEMKEIFMGDEAAPPDHGWPLCLVVEKKI
jgi:hypothetical protein